MFTAETLAGQTSSWHALRAALSVPALRESALGNAHLPVDLWLESYPAKPKPAVKAAKLLVTRNLPTQAMDHLIATETRATVLTTAFRETKPTLAQLTALLDSPALTPTLATAIVDDFPDVIDVDWLRVAAAKGGAARLEYWLAAPHEVTDAQIVADLLEYSSWGAEWDGNRQRQLLATRPAVLEGAVRSDSLKLRTAAAGCRFLTDPALQRAVADVDTPQAADLGSVPQAWFNDRTFVWVALVHNPVCTREVVEAVNPLLLKVPDYDKAYAATNRLSKWTEPVREPYEQVSDPSSIGRLLRRCLPGNDKKGQPHDLPPLLANPHLSEGDAKEVARCLSVSIGTLVRHPRVLALTLELMDRYPAAAAMHDMTPDVIRAQVADYRQASQPAPDPEPEPVHDPDTVRDVPWTQIRSDWRRFDQASAYFDATVGDSLASWLFLFRMLDQGDFTGTVADLAEIAAFTGAAA